ncbi:MAG TPA: hypothetical protein VHG91_01630 [Longimicrobium sp.]|nr:hypothetical protein [Longimicrobium sp.]
MYRTSPPRCPRRFDHGLRRLRGAVVIDGPRPAAALSPDPLRARLDEARAAIEARGWLVHRPDPR